MSATSSAAGVAAGRFGRSSALSSYSGSGSINSTNWSTTSQLDATKYYTVTIAPPSGCALSITSISVDAKASSSGPSSAVIGTSLDNFSQKGIVSTSVPSTPTMSVSNATNSVEVRIYAYSATSSSGTLRVQNTFTVSGSLQ